jgi:hypothetical protein
MHAQWQGAHDLVVHRDSKYGLMSTCDTCCPGSCAHTSGAVMLAVLSGCRRKHMHLGWLLWCALAGRHANHALTKVSA